MTRSEVTFRGYRANRFGLCVWPSRTPRHRWSDLISLQIEEMIHPRQVTAVLHFHSTRKRPLRLVCTRSLSWSRAPARFAALLEIALQQAPASARIEPLAREIARFGTAEMHQRWGRKHAHTPPHTPDEVYAKAQHHLAWLDPKKALRTLDNARWVGPLEQRHWLLRLRTLYLLGRSLPVQQAAAEAWANALPQDPEAINHVLAIRIARGDRAAAVEATQLLRTSSRPFSPRLAGALAGFYARRYAFDEAVQVMAHLAARTEYPAERAHAEAIAAEWRRDAADPTAKRRHRIRRGRAWLLALAPMLALLIPAGLRIADHYHREKQREELQRQASEMERRLAETRQRSEAILGWSFGSYAELKPRADAGEAIAQYSIARQLFAGDNGAPLDPVLALRYLRQAAEQNHEPALADLGSRLLEGDQVEPDPAAGVALLETAAAAGSGRAAYRLGNAFYEGKHVERDRPRAFAAYVRGAELDNPFAAARAGWMLEQGEEVAADSPRALTYYRQAAEQNNRWAQRRLVMLLASGQPPATDPVETWQWIERAAAEEKVPLPILYARLRSNGLPALPDHETGMWTEFLAEAESSTNGELAFLAATSFSTGTMTAPNFQEAYAWSERAYERGFDVALLAMISAQAYGVGTPRDIAAAIQRRDGIDSTRFHPDQLSRLDAMLTAATEAPDTPDDDDPGTTQILWRRPPHYPPILRQLDIEGRTVVQFQTDADGFVINPKVVFTTHPGFSGPALACVSFWRIAGFPQTEDGLSRPIRVPIHFTLQDDTTPVESDSSSD